ncbi:hypothetical protein [Caulobacter radicis]|uniref:hypothetical protein n=1 Tax=Caulobacter radicis TaxID=2172650 RepID=UPI001057C3C6|nr:hypothetical protein [Caulobacter radicis]
MISIKPTVVLGHFVHDAQTNKIGRVPIPRQNDAHPFSMPSWSIIVTWVDWFPIVFFPLKILVLGVGMFFSIKWHYDQGKKKKNETK